MMPWERRFSVAVSIAHALDYLHNISHRAVIHRDVKSSNILLSDDFHAHVNLCQIFLKILFFRVVYLKSESSPALVVGFRVGAVGADEQFVGGSGRRCGHLRVLVKS